MFPFFPPEVTKVFFRHHHTSFVNRAGSVINRVKKEIYPELLTQAWLKFYECLNEYSLVSGVKGSSFLSLHLCEAPGAFISALNHYLSLNHHVKVFYFTTHHLLP
jgi:cap2 methyltransferase